MNVRELGRYSRSMASTLCPTDGLTVFVSKSCPGPQPGSSDRGGLMVTKRPPVVAQGDDAEPRRSGLGLDVLAQRVRERNEGGHGGGGAGRSGGSSGGGGSGAGAGSRYGRGVMSISFEEDPTATVGSEVSKLRSEEGAAGAGSASAAGSSTAHDAGDSSSDAAAAGAGVMHHPKKRLRQSFRVDALPGAETPNRWDGSSFASHSTSTFTVEQGRRAPVGNNKWGSRGSGSTTPMTGANDTPLTRPASTPGWEGNDRGGGGTLMARNAFASASELPTRTVGVEDEEQFDREFYQMEVRSRWQRCCRSVAVVIVHSLVCALRLFKRRSCRVVWWCRKRVLPWMRSTTPSSVTRGSLRPWRRRSTLRRKRAKPKPVASLHARARSTPTRTRGRPTDC